MYFWFFSRLPFCAITTKEKEKIDASIIILSVITFLIFINQANCGGEMKFISFIEKRQMDINEKILRHCRLWVDPRDRSPPAMLLDDQSDFELEYIDCDEVLMDF